MEIEVLGMKSKMISSFRRAIIIATCVFSLASYAKEINDLPATIEKASKGESSYQSDLVDYYYNTAKNYNEAIKWSIILDNNLSAENHQKEYANRILGYCAYDGTGLNKSIEEAIKYWKQGGQYRGGECALLLARIYAKELQDSVESVKWYQKSAELENLTATYFLAQLYETGYDSSKDGKRIYYPGVNKDISQAVTYYEILIKNMGYFRYNIPENSKLLYKVAKWYYTGEGNLERNYTKAVDYFNRAIESNERCKEEDKLSVIEEGDAFWNISVCYRFGRGVEKDELIARRYVKRAAEKGNENAIALISK